MLINFISGKSLIAATLLASGGLGTIAVAHMNAHAAKAEFAVASTKSTLVHQSSTTQSQEGQSQEGQSQEGQSQTGTKATTPAINQGITSGASLHGLCVAYRAHLMMGGGATVNAETHLAHAHAFLELAEFATANGETIPVLCASQGGVSMSIMPTGHAHAMGKSSVTSNLGSQGSASSFALGNRP
ncbi:hypothetical protein [Ferrimicrobium sp.]|uniref:hypothetical protein n=1 Tax=Ferrimicrobium sp. TaxID=2926050 RepID=UPI0026346D81|nr:hypothetical protein [Ferrimicrobium sp.]